MVKQTAGREALGEFAPKFAELNDDVLFGEVWSREEKLSLKMRSVVTMTALISKGIVDNSLMYHLQTARKNGVSRTEMADLAVEVPGEETSNEWLEAVDDTAYAALNF